jgi:ketosteroid isomerase-like protein
MSEDNVQIARSSYEGFARGDLQAVLENFHTDVEWYAAEGLPWGGVHKGREAVAQDVFGALMANFDGFSLTQERVIDGGDYVVVLGRYGATARQTGKPLDAAFAHVWELEDGKLKRYFHYTDTLKFHEALS